MKALVINCGSSSVKYGLYVMPESEFLGGGIVDRITQKPSQLRYEYGGDKQTCELEVEGHSGAVRLILDDVLDPRHGLASEGGRIDAVGHRVVHGGDIQNEAALIDADILGRIEKFAPMAPLHDPPSLVAIQTAMEVLPDIPHVACFDTAFHCTIPEVAYMYALPLSLYRDYGVRRYGFHGISCRFVASRAAKMLGRPVEQLNAIICHLGNGCSITAIENGCSVDTSMGMTPLEGLVMGTRAGDLDPGILFYLVEKGVDPEELKKVVNRKSGLLGLSGVSSDMRDVLQAAQDGNSNARLAVAVFCYHLRKYIGAYMAVVCDLHALVFTGGIGENAAEIRRQACVDLRHMGIEIDVERNEKAVGAGGDIATNESQVRVLVVPTDEELAIADSTYHLVVGLAKVPASAQ
jgi:acetate kinase